MDVLRDCAGSRTAMGTGGWTGRDVKADQSISFLDRSADGAAF